MLTLKDPIMLMMKSFVDCLQGRQDWNYFCSFWEPAAKQCDNINLKTVLLLETTGKISQGTYFHLFTPSTVAKMDYFPHRKPAV
ncbi:unnamed protein product [Caretta caretta]